jgi:tRNA-intron endonuclease
VKKSSTRGYTVVFDTTKCKGYVTGNAAEELVERWFGKYEDNRLSLDLVEVSYLLLSGYAQVVANDRAITTLEELASVYGECFKSFFWPMLSVYKDLRDRGRRVRILEPMKFLVKDKSGHLRLVFILEEKSPVSINILEQLVEEARRNNMLATLAIVSLQGELTYYEIVQADLRAT